MISAGRTASHLGFLAKGGTLARVQFPIPGPDSAADGCCLLCPLWPLAYVGHWEPHNLVPDLRKLTACDPAQEKAGVRSERGGSLWRFREGSMEEAFFQSCLESWKCLVRQRAQSGQGSKRGCWIKELECG